MFVVGRWLRVHLDGIRNPNSMCGIIGFVFDAESRDVAAALGSLHHRGPDASGVFRAPGVVLGHTRLAILDLSVAAIQPMTSSDGRVVVVFNGEIYNHHELRRDLEQRGHRFRTRSDTEVIVVGYLEHGVAFIERLDGMFAIGLFDARTQTLILARDRTGKKPLFYTATENGGLCFGSEVRALAASGIRLAVNLSALPMLLSLGYVPPPETLYVGIRQLQPASILVFRRGQSTRLETYWRAPFDGVPLRIEEKDAEREVRRLVESAVVRRLEADVPLGAFLSGGIDSTIVVGLMARAMTTRVKTFSIGFRGDPAYDETPFARLAARRFATDHTEFTLDHTAFDLLDKIVMANDGPFGDSSTIPTAVVSMLTRKHVAVALTGDGGDELFAGYPRMLAAELTERLPHALRVATRRLASLLPEGAGSDRVKRFVSTAAMSVPDKMLRWQSYFVDDLRALLRREVCDVIDIGAAQSWGQTLSERTTQSTPLTRALQFNFDSYLPSDLLVKADRMSMLHGLELRSPFLDTALIDFAARLPDRCRRRGTTTKWALRRAFQDLVPRTIRQRSKRGFGMPLALWFRTSLRSFVRDTLGASAKVGQYLDLDHIERIITAHERQERNMEHRIWLLLTMERWLNLLPEWSPNHAPV